MRQSRHFAADRPPVASDAGSFHHSACAVDIDHLAQWVGREELARDVVTAAPLAGLAATLDRDEPPPRPGDALPPLAHWLYFLPAAPPVGARA